MVPGFGKDSTDVDALAVIIADPSRIDAVPAAELPDLIGALESLKARLWARLNAPTVAPAAPAPASPDRLLDVNEAAGRLGVTARWMYRKAASLPFTRRPSPGTLRFSERGLERWKEAQR
jgi:hypothetical protein